jgi:hypothetical protein
MKYSFIPRERVPVLDDLDVASVALKVYGDLKCDEAECSEGGEQMGEGLHLSVEEVGMPTMEAQCQGEKENNGLEKEKGLKGPEKEKGPYLSLTRMIEVKHDHFTRSRGLVMRFKSARQSLWFRKNVWL